MGSLPFTNQGEDGDGNNQPPEGPATPPHQDIPIHTDYVAYDCFSKKGLHFFHLNIRSILPKISELRLFAASTKVSIISITETWLDNSISDDEIAIPGFLIARRDRNRNGGGVCTYIRDNIAFNIRDDLHMDGFEALWIEILLPKTRPIMLCTCYRPPKDSEFILYLEQSLSTLRSDLEFYVLGDMNICLNNDKSCLAFLSR